MKRILICLSLDPFDEHLVRYVKQLAPLTGKAQIHVVHVMADTPQGFPNLDLADALDEDSDGFDPEDLRSYAEKLGLPGHKLIVAVLKGSASEEILRYLHAWEIDLLLLGKRNHDEGSGYLAAQLASRSPASIWAVPDVEAPQFERVLVATDFSDPSKRAFRCAIEVADGLGQNPQMTVFTAFHVPTGYFKAGMTYDQMADRIREATADGLKDWLKELEIPRFAVQTEVAEDDRGTAAAILDAAERNRADLIVIGSKGRSRLTAFLLGSTTDRLLRNNHRFPVLVARSADDGTKKLLKELFSVE